jgi:hypothetical protein
VRSMLILLGYCGRLLLAASLEGRGRRELKLTEQQHRKLAAEADRAARRKGLNQVQRENYLLKAFRFRYLARLAAQLAKEPTEQHLRGLAADMDRAARRRGLSQEQRENCLARANHFRLLARKAAERAHEKPTGTKPDLLVVEP